MERKPNPYSIQQQHYIVFLVFFVIIPFEKFHDTNVHFIKCIHVYMYISCMCEHFIKVHVMCGLKDLWERPTN